jgi:hypothetical protein
MWVCKQIFWLRRVLVLDISKESTACSLRVKENDKKLKRKKYKELCLFLGHCLACTSWQHCVTFKMTVTATWASNPVSWSPLLGKKDPCVATKPAHKFVSFSGSTINWVLVRKLFLRNDNMQSFILKQMIKI